MYLYLIFFISITLIYIINRLANILSLKYSFTQFDIDFIHLNKSRCSLFSSFDKYINSSNFTSLIKTAFSSFDNLPNLELNANLLAEIVLNYINNLDRHLKSGELIDLENQILDLENQYSSHKAKARNLESIYFNCINRVEYKLFSNYFHFFKIPKPLFIYDSKEVF